MGSKFRYFGIGLVLCSIAASAQTVPDFRSVDSLSFRYYISGDWNELTKLGDSALNNEIDYKFLRQRLGFAYFSEGDYIKSVEHFEKALAFDGFDTFTLTYLFYSYLNSGQSENAGFIAGKMPSDLRKRLSVKSFQPVESIDFEYNFKYSASGRRSNPQYYHFGVNSHLLPGLELYQMFSHYNQTFTFPSLGGKEYVRDRQDEYYSLLKFVISPHLMVKSSYHCLNPDYDTISSPMHLGYLELSTNFGRFNFGINTSFLKGDKYSVNQSGIKAGVAFSGNLNMYFNGALSLISKQNTSRLIYNQTAGFRVSKKVWLEGNITFGDLTDYHDHDAMYVYDLIDPTIFRTGATLIFFSGKHITLWANYSYELKEYFENNLYHYNQFCYLGGLRWKL